MARERDDDDDYDRDYDERPRRRERNEDDYDERPLSRGDARRGAVRAKTPGTILAAVAGISLALVVMQFALNIINPGFFANLYIDNIFLPIAQAQPPSPQRDARIREMQLQKQAANEVNPISIGANVLAIGCNVLAMLGGLKMRAAEGYGLAMTGSIAAIIPCSGCCLLTLPVGIWALVVLLDIDVKAAFARSRR